MHIYIYIYIYIYTHIITTCIGIHVHTRMPYACVYALVQVPAGIMIWCRRMGGTSACVYGVGWVCVVPRKFRSLYDMSLVCLI